jgi:hypothetical protein
MRFRTVVLAIAVLAAAWPAHGAPTRRMVPLVVDGDMGGEIVPRAAEVRELLESGRRVFIRRECFSSCTMYLTLPRGQVCVMPTARLLFHAPYERGTGRIDPVVASFMFVQYPLAVQRWLRARGGLGKHNLILEGLELAALVDACPTERANLLDPEPLTN